MRTEKGKNILLIVLMTGLIFLTIAYASLVQRLDIKSSAVIKNKDTSWDVHFRTVECTPTGTAEVTSPLSPSASNTTELSGLVATFKSPGDSVVCTFYVENSGDIDAKVTAFNIQDSNYTITYTGSGDNKTADEALVNGMINYSLVYDDNNAVPAVDDQLNSKATRKLRLTLSLSDSLNELPEKSVEITNFNSYIIYGQN